MPRLSSSFLVALLVLVSACAAELAEEVHDTHAEAPDDAPDLGRVSSDLSLSRLGRGCTTAGTEGLSAQLLEEMICLADGAVVEVRHPNIVPTSSRVHVLLSPEGRDALLRAADGGRIEINSAFRTLAEQYVLYRGCSVAAQPGRSNHETGRAIDVNNHGVAGRRLTAAGFSHPMPSSDPVHYEAGGDDLRSLSVRAFQRLWNANHPEDRIAESDTASSATLDRLSRAPAEGFAVGRVCTATTVPPVEPPPAPPPVTGTSCSHSLGGVYAAGACSASYQCCDGAWALRARGCGACACVDETGRTGCTTAPAPSPPPTATRPPYDEVIGTGVTYRWLDRSRIDRVLIVYGGYGASDAASAGWAAQLDRAWHASRDGAHLFTVRGPAAVDYSGLEIGNSRIVRRLRELATAAGGPLEITVVAHSSGAFVARELFQQLLAARTSAPVSASITYFDLDGARLGVDLSILAAYCPVYATAGSLRSPNADTAIAEGRTSESARKGRTLVVDATGSGCTGSWCVHDALITSRPHNPSGLDVARDYTDFTGRPVVIDYLVTGCVP